MKIQKAGYEILTPISEGGVKELQHIERIGRVCYKSEDKITEDGESAKKFVKMLINAHHEAMIEHSTLSVMFTVDRGVSHEMVRHRIASFAQESTRYVNYSKDKFGNEINVIDLRPGIELDRKMSGMSAEVIDAVLKESGAGHDRCGKALYASNRAWGNGANRTFCSAEFHKDEHHDHGKLPGVEKLFPASHGR